MVWYIYTDHQRESKKINEEIHPNIHVSTFPITTLSNGIRVVVQPSKSSVCHCGIIIGTGSRDEKPEEYGMAHFIEHTIFKGTRRRTGIQILNRLDEVGGELNAYTTKDETAVHAAVLGKDLERAIELLADMVFCPTFPEKEIIRERDVILDEINSYKDTPSELIFDDFEERVFYHPALAHNILGTTESLMTFNGDSARRFIERAYHTDNIVLSVLGDVDAERVFRLAEKHLGHYERKHRPKDFRQSASRYCRITERENRGYNQAHILMGNIAPSALEDGRVPLYILNNILGGPCMNAILSVALREKNGIAYNVESDYTTFSDVGLEAIYFGTDADKVTKSIRIVNRELDKICGRPFSETRLNRIKRQIEGQLLLATEDKESMMLSAARSILLYGEAKGIESSVEAIRAVDSKEIQEIACRVFDPSQMSVLVYG
ncbi:MAG: pitrilysin family protein [Bacteroidia bacterium]|nr:pitrilysin family protein [Bacteroidia bacterium]